MLKLELTPKNGRKSFYGNAHVIIDGSKAYLLSHNTIIGVIDHSNGTMHRYSEHQSNATECHVKAFFPDAKGFWRLPLEDAPSMTITL